MEVGATEVLKGIKGAERGAVVYEEEDVYLVVVDEVPEELVSVIWVVFYATVAVECCDTDSVSFTCQRSA